MRDPHIHVEHDITILTHAEIRAFIASRVGVIVSTPKTVSTGCNVRRPYAMTSTIPAHVTCLPCREFAYKTYTDRAQMAHTALSLGLGTVDERALIEAGMLDDSTVAAEFGRAL